MHPKTKHKRKKQTYTTFFIQTNFKIRYSDYTVGEEYCAFHCGDYSKNSKRKEDCFFKVMEKSGIAIITMDG